MNSILYTSLAAYTLLALSALPSFASASDKALRKQIRQADVKAIPQSFPQNPAKVELGRMLYFDKILSGNRDVACSTCHLASQLTGDGLSLGIGTGGHGLGKDRELGEGRSFIPRNAPDIFNRGMSAWTTMFWDSRVMVGAKGEFLSPAKEQLPQNLDSLLAVQALFPVTSRDEMRGAAGDLDIFGATNELAMIADTDFVGIWAALMKRLQANQEYAELFAAAYPQEKNLGYEHVANAIAAFEAQSFYFAHSPFDRYLRGNNQALTKEQKRGAKLFFGKAACASCHNGPLLTDQKSYNLLVPQFGPGKDTEEGIDFGRQEASKKPEDAFKFRTPALRNVAITGPWMHNGAYDNLFEVIFHHMDPYESCSIYEPNSLPEALRETYDVASMERLLGTFQEETKRVPYLSNQEIEDLLAFLLALTDPAATDMYHMVPKRVPSGLPIDG